MNMTSRSRDALRPRFASQCPALEKRGRREDRVLAAPAVSRAKCANKTHTSIQVQRKHSGLPCAMALRLMPCSPRRRVRLVTVTAGLMADRLQWESICHRQLGTSNGCRDHTVLPYASAPFVLRGERSLTENRPAITSHARRCRVHRPLAPAIFSAKLSTNSW